MANINRVVLVGNLTKDPELRHTPSGTAVCKLRIAVNTRQKDAQGNWGDKPNYFDVTVWGNQGESCAQYEAKTFEDAQAVAERLGQVELRFDVKAGPTGSLFGSVTPTDIADELWTKHKVRVDRRKIHLDTIKRIGRYQVPIELFQDVTAEVRTLVVPEGGELPPEEELEAMAAEEQAEQ